ncbi:NADPH-dependent FMN reductase [Actinomycetospora termitidis]|uniref:NAD(P)H-dependent oxidoreductase n=1 Tax=Actinomycetospora termitidis TaxID=3053470 RepID=A0ABT7MEW9_9PSEU|nr:NAD(P)H-dependent oxidoreductase [Actinomycetospora sp. Odt1-22]MDL5157918.1 NAD(P)H-dependent oxidoreductase [Actinomycetospora sp. Odt1-22]
MSDDARRPLLQIVVASTRPGRIGEPIARWFGGYAQDHGAFDVEIVDLAEIALPMFAEPEHPRLGRYTLDSTKDFSATIARADAFVFVTPEYNHSFTAPLKNALDHLNREWAGKPATIVSYGGVAAGTRAAEALWPVLVGLNMVPVSAAVPIPFAMKNVSGEGDQRVFTPAAETEAGAKGALDGLSAWIDKLGLLGERA